MKFSKVGGDFVGEREEKKKNFKYNIVGRFTFYKPF